MSPRSAVPVLLLLIASAASALDCGALSSVRLPDIRILSAEQFDTGEVPVAAPPTGAPAVASEAVVPHCKVEGVIGSEIRFELLLPARWNGKFLMGGGGGFVGALGYQGRFSINLGYATAATDTGHKGSGVRADWALGQPERRVNYGYLAVHRATEAAKAIVREHYGREAARSYFYGCSNGGRQAMMSAQRFPEDFDGIVAGAPAHDFSGVLAAFAYNMQRMFPDSDRLDEAVVRPENLRLLETSVLARCDAADSLEDGILNDPRDCDFRLSDLPLCPGSEPADHCLTVRQREAVAAVYDGPRNSRGRLYPGFPFGGESEEGGWQAWITGPNPRMAEQFGEPSLQFAFATQGFKFLIHGDPEFDYSTYDFDDYERDSAHLEGFLDATSVDLSNFKQSGGKLILWHGWSDAALTALASIDYFERVERLDPQVRDYFRLFLMPGVLHCAGGPGPDRVDWLSALDRWVEDGEPPQVPVAYKVEDGLVVRSRPLCAYPERAEYQGGDPDDAASFACTESP